MKKLLLLSICFSFFCSVKTIAQASGIHKKYTVSLPEEWKKQSRFLYKLVKVINWHIPELAEKKVCFDCTAGYSVQFHVSPATVDFIYYNQGSNYNFTTLFTFYAYMDVIDSVGKIFHRLVLNDTGTLHSLRYNMAKGGATVPLVQNTLAQLKENALPALQNGQRDIRTNPEERAYNMSMLSRRFDDIAFIKANKAAMTPTERQLWYKVQEIIQAFDIPGEPVTNEQAKPTTE